jgi:hypothetical protein
MSYGAQPLPLGSAGAAVNPAALAVRAPAGPTGATGPEQWLWMMRGALQ